MIATALRRTSGGKAAPAFVSATSAESTSTFTTPSGATGDIIVAACRSSIFFAPAITGFTALANGSDGYTKLTVAYRVCDGTESGSYTWTGGTVDSCGAVRYSGATSVAINTLKSTGTTTVSFNAITTPSANNTLVECVAFYPTPSAGQKGPSSGYTSRVNASKLVMAEAVAATAGSYTPGTWTANDWTMTGVVALIP